MITPAVETALRGADDTRAIEIGAGAVANTGKSFLAAFGDRAALVVSDANTHAAAGAGVLHSLSNAGISCSQLSLPADPPVYADYQTVTSVATEIKKTDAIPVAVGSGTINDVVKLASHMAARPYMVVATAASMDGYTAFGASISRDGYKQTFSCPAPIAVVADTDIIAAAPQALTASGYADLLAKITAGADWIIADALGVESIHEQAWHLIQDNLLEWTNDPEAIAAGERSAVEHLTEGLLIAGLAMQAHRNSRPASGAEHQFSHLWEMEHLEHGDAWLSHGFKVGIGTIAVAAMYEQFLIQDPTTVDVEALVSTRLSRDQLAAAISAQHDLPILKEKGVEESLAKYPDDEQLRARIAALADQWEKLHKRLERQLLPAEEIRSRLQRAGCPSDPADIGIDRTRLHRSYHGAQQIRKRYTVLDLAKEIGVFDACVDVLFEPGGFWLT